MCCSILNKNELYVRNDVSIANQKPGKNRLLIRTGMNLQDTSQTPPNLVLHSLRKKAAMGIVYNLHIKLKENLADCLTKHLTHGPLRNFICFTSSRRIMKLRSCMV
jgi:hypothetical protein